MVGNVGVTIILEPVRFPGFHVYVVAPVATKVNCCPEQPIFGMEVAEIDGGFPTLITCMSVAVVVPEVAVNVTLKVPDEVKEITVEEAFGELRIGPAGTLLQV